MLRMLLHRHRVSVQILLSCFTRGDRAVRALGVSERPDASAGRLNSLRWPNALPNSRHRHSQITLCYEE